MAIVQRSSKGDSHGGSDSGSGSGSSGSSGSSNTGSSSGTSSGSSSGSPNDDFGGSSSGNDSGSSGSSYGSSSSNDSGSSGSGSSGSGSSGSGSSNSSYDDDGDYGSSGSYKAPKCRNTEGQYVVDMRRNMYSTARLGLEVVTLASCLAALVVALRSPHLSGWGRWVKASITLLTLGHLFGMVNYAMIYGIWHSPDRGFSLNQDALLSGNFALSLLQTIFDDTAAVAAFVAVMSLCSNLVRGSHAGAMRVATFTLAGLLQLAVLIAWGFFVADVVIMINFFKEDPYRAGFKQIERIGIMETKAQWALAIFELIVVLVAVARAVSVLARGGGKSAAGSKAPAWLATGASVLLLARAAWRLADTALSYDPITGLSNPCHQFEFWRPYIMGIVLDAWMVLGAVVCLIVAAQRISAAGFASTQYS